MPNAAPAYPERYGYFHPNHRRARARLRTHARGQCQGCGYGRAEEAHHYDLRYPPAETITADRMTAFCRLCHRIMTLFRRFLSVGGDPWLFLTIFKAALDEAGEATPRTGRPRRVGAQWGALVAGRSRPRVGEILQLRFRDGGWAFFTVTHVVDGEPGRWRVITSWPKAKRACSNGAGRNITGNSLART